MYGVDLEAAKLALKNGGNTVAVLGYGTSHCFPKSQKKTMEEFYEKGAIFMSEFPPEMPPIASNFVMRNRIVAGLSPATIVIEAAARSGSHITASYANDYGRLVMAVPGPISNPFSEGTKDLISQGATLVNSGQDILSALSEDYHWSDKLGEDKRTDKLSQEQKTLIEKFKSRPELSFEELYANSLYSRDQLNQLLFDLQLQGKISKNFGKYCLLRL